MPYSIASVKDAIWPYHPDLVLEKEPVLV